MVTSTRRAPRLPDADQTALPLTGAAADRSTTTVVSVRVTLPANLPAALQTLNETELQALFEALVAERQRRQLSPLPAAPLPPPMASAPPQTGHGTPPARPGKSDEVPLGKANLIRASFRSGMKPAVIARTFGLPQAAVMTVLGKTTPSK